MLAQILLLSCLAANAISAPSHDIYAPHGFRPHHDVHAPHGFRPPHDGFRPHHDFHSSEYGELEHHHIPPRYSFEYFVDDPHYGVNFNQQEERDGHHTQGSYAVALPDGRIQRVTYYVDGDSGFVAEVSYEGEAHFSDHHHNVPSVEYGPSLHHNRPLSFDHRPTLHHPTSLEHRPPFQHHPTSLEHVPSFHHNRPAFHEQPLPFHTAPRPYFG